MEFFDVNDKIPYIPLTCIPRPFHAVIKIPEMKKKPNNPTHFFVFLFIHFQYTK